MKSSPKKANKDDSDSSCAEDSERGEDSEEENNQKQFEWVPSNGFKELYKCTPIYKCMEEYG